MARKEVQVREKKLGRHRYEGYQIVGWTEKGKNFIEIDSRLKNRRKLRTIIHELCHLAFPEACETKILEAEKIIGNTLWREGYRKNE